MKSLVVALLLISCVPPVQSFSPPCNNGGRSFRGDHHRQTSNGRHHHHHLLVSGRRRRRRQQGSLSAVSSSTTNDDDSIIRSDPSPSSSLWLDKGLLLSSFTDGLKSNRDVQDWLCNALVERFWRDVQGQYETKLQQSNRVSPCNGPDPTLWKQLEEIDETVQELYPPKKKKESETAVGKDASSWRQSLAKLQKQQFSDNRPIELRMLYIPTALYALRNDSTNTPGKQRQRARADGKNRRNEIVQLLQDNFDGLTISAVTLDFDDGSVKQPECSSSSNASRDSAAVAAATFPKVREILLLVMLTCGHALEKQYQCALSNRLSRAVNFSFYQTGKEAIGDWKPHLIYVQGGNTFWLHHCMEKGGWNKDLITACCCSNNAAAEAQASTAVYCGVSAGAILVGKSMQTACWKGWDDPSVVPGRATYDDWKVVSALGLAGSVSFFPHMEEQWQAMVDNQIQGSSEATIPNAEEDAPIICCLCDQDACFVEGHSKSILLQSTGALTPRPQQAAAL